MEFQNFLMELDDSELDEMEPNDQVRRMYEWVDEAAEKFLNKKKRFSEDKSKVRQIPTNLRRLLRKKLKLSKRCLTSSSWQTNHEIKMEIEEVERELYVHYEERRGKVEREAIERIKDDIGYFYSYDEKFSKDYSKMSDLKVGGRILMEYEDKANALQDQYKSVWSEPSDRVDKEMINYYFKECEECELELVHCCNFDCVLNHIRKFGE